MKRLFHSQSLIKLIFVLTLFLLSSNGPLQAATSPDVIGFRVMPNPDHSSPQRWYQGNIKLKGSPQVLTVDGYEAVRDGRTVYVNAANISSPNNPNSKFYSNIYIISYNQQADDKTVDIFGQILTHWKFNANITDPDQKGEIVRDTKRLADLADIKSALANYQKGHSGAYPGLSAGSYLSGKTISVWPSWQATLGAALSVTMPLDPINKLGTCPGGYNATTCWDQTNKKFAGTVAADGSLTLPADSRAYVYTIDAKGTYRVCALMESGYITDLAQGACPGSAVGHSAGRQFNELAINCGALQGYEKSKFIGYVSVNYSGSIQWQINPSRLSSWPSDMTIQGVTAVSAPRQAKLSVAEAGATGTYLINITATNSFAESVSTACSITIGKIQPVPCGAKPANTVWWGDRDKFMPAWNGSALLPVAKNSSYSSSDTGAECIFHCASRRDSWNGAHCVVISKKSSLSVSDTGAEYDFTCAAKPAAGTDWNTVSHYIQTWSGTAWSPADSITAFNNDPSSDSCRYKCAANHRYDSSGNSCKTYCGNGVLEPINGEGINEACDGTAGTPTHATCQSDCAIKCAANYTWNNTSCVCAPKTRAQACGTNDCGSASDGCGGTISCGVCTAPRICSTTSGAGTCACTPESDAILCSRLGKNCGSITANDNCGASRTVSSCGTCASPQTCGSNNVCACTPESDAILCSRLGKNCGSITANDNCSMSRTVSSCGTCASPQTCDNNNVCVCSETCNVNAPDQPNCQASAPINSEAGAGACCNSQTCYKCAANYTWNGTRCLGCGDGQCNNGETHASCPSDCSCYGLTTCSFTITGVWFADGFVYNTWCTERVVFGISLGGYYDYTCRNGSWVRTATVY